MAAKQRKLQNQAEPNAVAEKLERISNLLGLLVAKGLSEGDKVGALSAVGFGNQEIARLLGKDRNTVDVFLSLRRKKSQKKKHK